MVITITDINNNSPQVPNSVTQNSFFEGSAPSTRAILDTGSNGLWSTGYSSATRRRSPTFTTTACVRQSLRLQLLLPGLAGLLADLCQDDTAECDTAPCLNNNTCVEILGSCSCRAGSVTAM